MIVALNIGFRIDQKWLLKDFDLSFEKGNLHLIIGENGAGKSTLIKLLSGQLKPSTGNVLIDGLSVQKQSLSSLAKSRAVLSQSLDFAFPMTVNEVLLLGRYPHFNERPQSADFEIINECARLFEVLPFLERAYETLSGGEKQRVQFARVFAQIWSKSERNNILFLDEPLTYLDLAHQLDFIKKLIHIIQTQKLTVIGVLHDLNLAARFADQIILLKNGQLIDHGKPDDVLSIQNLETIYGLTPSFVNGMHGRLIEF